MIFQLIAKKLQSLQVLPIPAVGVEICGSVRRLDEDMGTVNSSHQGWGGAVTARRAGKSGGRQSAS